MQRKLDRKGFSIIEVLVVVVIIAAVAACGWLAWRHANGKKKQTSSTTASSQQAKSPSKSSPAQTTDPYVGWRSYCDTTYKYCFKYPSGWTVQDTTAAAKPGDEGGIDLLSPDQSVQVIYSNAYAKDGSLVDFVATTISKLMSANQDVTLVGGYAPSSGDNGLVRQPPIGL